MDSQFISSAVNFAWQFICDRDQNSLQFHNPKYLKSLLYNDKKVSKKRKLGRPRRRNTFNFICEELRPTLERRDTQLRSAVSLEKRIAVALHLQKSSCDSSTVADLHRLGESTVKKALHDFCSAVEVVLRPKFLSFPTKQKPNEIVQGFESKWDFPHCVGALDGSHIPIQRPAECGTDYFNYKKYVSIVLMAVADHSYKFWYANVGQPGRNSDSTVFARTKLHQGLSSGTFLDAAAFPLQNWLMKPYLDNENTPEYQFEFNLRLSRARMVIENAFGRLKGRWRILLRRIDATVPTTVKIVNTCLVLHNICESMDSAYLEEWDDGDDTRPIGNYGQPIMRPHNSSNVTAKAKRDAIANLLLLLYC